jgi:hypothetical protein
MKIMVLRALIKSASAAGHVVLSPIPTAWDIRGTQRSRRPSPRALPQVTQQKTSLSQGGL